MLRSLGGKSRFRSSPRRPIRRERLAVEALEARDVPAAFTWVQTDPGTFNWSNGGNWTGGPAGAFPNDPADIASITSVLNGDETINIQGAIAVDSAVVGATGGGGTFTLHFDLNGTTPGSGYSQLTAADTVTLTAAALGLSVGVGFTVPDATSFTLIDAANPIVGTFAGLPEGATFAAGGETFRITYQGGADGNDVVLTSETPPAFTSPAAATFYTGMTNTFTVAAPGIPDPTYTVTAGALPAGVTLNATTGVLSGTTAGPGTFNVTITADNGVGTPVDQPFILTVEAGAAPGITSANNATFVTGTGGTFSVAATGNPAPTYGVATGTLPAGTTLNATTGVLTVGPTTASGVYSFTLSATNPLGTSTQPFTLTVDAAPLITSPAAATFFTGMNNAFQLIATGLPTPTFGVTSGSLPSGVNLSSDGVLAGVPSATGSFPVTITATNGVNPDAVQNFALTVTAGTPPGITNPNNVSVVAGVGGTFAFTAAGAPSPTFAVVSGALPTGASLGAATGVLTVGTNTPAGTYDFSVRATNPLGTSTQPFRLTVGTPPAITSANAVTFYTGTFNTFTMTATGSPDVTFSETGPLPAGVGLLTNGILSGQPIAAGVYPITVTAANGVGSPATRPFTLTVETGIVPGFISAGVASFTPGVGGTFQVAATGNPTPVLAQTASLPTGVTFTPTTGVLAVAPSTAAGRYTLTFTATSVIGQATQTFTLDVTTVPAFTSANVVSLAAGTGGTFQITASGAPTPT
ncbi:MAG: putative Ig domain-containing protein, partial [Gemmataceae bacterium]|nr:putative Ig domain-containing protein [Gemmataceae bacterium]